MKSDEWNVLWQDVTAVCFKILPWDVNECVNENRKRL